MAQFQQVGCEPEYFDAWVELGLTMKPRRHIQVERVFANLLRDDNPQIAFKLADLNLKLNDPDQALAVILEYPDEPDLALEAASLFISQDFPEHAAELLDPLAEQTPIPADALFYLAVLEYEHRDNPDQALAYLEAIPVGHPHHERSLLFRVHVLYQNGRETQAENLCLEAAKRFPSQPDFLLTLAEMKARQDDYSAALDTMLKADATWPDNTVILYQLGALYERMEKRDKALAVMEKIIHLEPEHADALNFLGYTLADEGRDLERAEVLIQNALRIKPDNGYYIDSLAWVYFRRGKLNPAWQEIAGRPFCGDGPGHLGTLRRHRGLGLPGEARKGYSRSLN